MTEPQPFSQPTRQSPAAIIFILGRVLRLLFRQLWYLIPVIIFNKKGSAVNGFTLFFLGLAGVSAIMSLLNYFRLYFYIKDGELVLEKGVFRKSKISVPLDRIQTVNFHQNLLHQILSVVAVDIDTAGSASKEFSLHALTKPMAEALREVVGNHRKVDSSSVGRSSPDSSGWQSASGDLEETIAEPSAQYPIPNTQYQSEIFHLRPLDLVKIGVSQNHLRTAGILMAFLLSFADDLEQAMGVDFDKKVNSVIGSTDGSTMLMWLLVGIPFLLFVSFLGTLIRTVLQYFDLRFWRTERGFKIVSGLFTRQEVSAILTKIQYVSWSSSPLMRIFKMVKVRMPQAASVEVSGKLSVGLPGCYEPQLSAMRAAYFPMEKEQDWEQHGIAKFNIWLRFLLIGPLPAFILVLITRSWMGDWSHIWWGWLVLSALLAWQWQRTWIWEVSEEGLRASWGVINRKSVLLQWYKVQAVTTQWGFFSSPTGRSKLTFYTAAGEVHIPYISVAMAAAVQDFALYKIETDVREWM